VCVMCARTATLVGIEHGVHGETAATLNEFYGILDPVRRLEENSGCDGIGRFLLPAFDRIRLIVM
jgi:hypothetical protein